jgi:hypothetical protein
MDRQLDEQIHIALGYKKVPWPQKEGQDTIGCEGGWAWESPEGNHYEGNMLVVPRYTDTLAEAARILPALLKVYASNS